jgi:hypothetical protein
MKKLYLVGKAVLGLSFVIFTSSCATSTNTYSQMDDGNPHFRDDGSVNAVLQFSSWDYTFLVRPQYAEGGYLQQVRRENIDRVFDQMKVRRGTVVVVVGWTYKGEVLDKVVSDWKTILGGCGFQRVVVLRAQLGDNLNGSIIVDDSTTHFGSVQSAARGG